MESNKEADIVVLCQGYFLHLEKKDLYPHHIGLKFFRKWNRHDFDSSKASQSCQRLENDVMISEEVCTVLIYIHCTLVKELGRVWGKTLNGSARQGTFQAAFEATPNYLN